MLQGVSEDKDLAVPSDILAQAIKRVEDVLSGKAKALSDEDYERVIWGK